MFTIKHYLQYVNNLKIRKRHLSITKEKTNQAFIFHLTGIFGNFGENSNGTVHPGGMFSEKKAVPFEVFPFFRLYWCTVPFGGKFSPVFPVKWKAPSSLHSAQFPRALIEISLYL